MASWSDFLVAMGLSEAPPVADAKGLVHWGRMDAAFTSKCAVWADGRVVIADGYSGDAHVREVLRELRYTGVVPQQLRERTGTLEEVARAWGGGEEQRGSRLADPAQVEKLFQIFEQAVEAGADDVMFERSETDCRVYVLVNDRKLQVGKPLTREEGQWMVEHLFYCANEGSRQVSLSEAEPQGWGVNGREMKLPGSVIALRCESGSDSRGFHLVSRMFVTGRISEDTSIEDLGFSSEFSELLREIRMTSFGMVLFVGSTGDGKSTTNVVNFRLLLKESNYEKNAATLEDPVENFIRGALQMELPTAGSEAERAQNFEKFLRHFVRIHPAAGLIGEIRDGVGAQQVIRFVDSGHQIYTTMHGDSANGGVFRLVDLVGDASAITKPGILRLIVKQTLLSVLCPNCCVERPVDGVDLPEGLERAITADVRFRNTEGCEECLKGRRTELSRLAWAGYINRLAFAEWIRPDHGYLECVQAGNALGALHYWKDDMGGVTIGTKIWRAVEAGMVDPFDALSKGAEVDEAIEVFTGEPARPRPGRRANGHGELRP